MPTNLNQIEIKNILATSCFLNISGLEVNRIWNVLYKICPMCSLLSYLSFLFYTKTNAKHLELEDHQI